jgi:3,4-dihydroxy 2-butanone 4-phosphate synthase/GTP cyclohydrolase II
MDELQIKQQVCARIPTDLGEYRLCLYTNNQDDKEHLAIVLGEVRNKADVMVRIHSECFTGDVLGSRRCDCGEQLQRAMQIIALNGEGVVLYLRQEGRGIGLAHKIHAYALQEKGLDTVEANERLGFEADLRDYSAAAQILRDLGLAEVRLITNNPTKVTGLERYGVKVAERVPLVIPSTEHNRRYLRAKKEKLGHIL